MPMRLSTRLQEILPSYSSIYLIILSISPSPSPFESVTCQVRNHVHTEVGICLIGMEGWDFWLVEDPMHCSRPLLHPGIAEESQPFIINEQDG